MENNERAGKVVREFKLTTLSLENKNTIFLLTILLALFGLIAYNTMPLELFPEINMPQVFVTTIYPGNPPIDIENLITRPLEKELNGITGLKELRSLSTQDASNIVVEFNTDINLSDALQDVKDAVDKAKSELPDDLDMDPMVTDFDINELPIIDINISGDYSVSELKDYADYLEDEIEAISEVSKVEVKGLNAREILLLVDPHKLENFQLSFQDIEDAVNFENMNISGGDLIVDKTSRSIRTSGEFKSISEIRDIVIKNEDDNLVYLRDVADVVDGFEDPQTFARLDQKPVVALQVIKKTGENLVNATDKIFKVIDESLKSGTLPENLSVVLANDQSEHVRKMVNNLENSIIMGVIFVVLVLFFFLGLRNSIFVGLAIPMSMFMSFTVLQLMGQTVNMMVLFGMVLALGMLVDNAIVTVENVYRFVHQGYSLFSASKHAVGEIAMPIISSTATTLAAFLPLVFWKGLVGEFMKVLPVTLIIVLTASLIYSLVMVPVLTLKYFKKSDEIKAPTKPRTLKIVGVMLLVAILSYIAGANSVGSILVMTAVLVLLNFLFLHRASVWFQENFLTWLENFYLKVLKFSLNGKRPVWVLTGTGLLMIFSIMFFAIRTPSVVFFPVNEPNFINIFAEMPVGTEITATNEFSAKLETKVFEVLAPYKDIVKSLLTTVGKGVVENEMDPPTNTPHKAMLRIDFVDYEERGGVNTSTVMKQLSAELLDKYPGVKISVAKDQSGPPTGKPINIEVKGEKFDKLLTVATEVQQYLETSDTPGVEGLKLNLDSGLPELVVQINRVSARRFGMSTAQIASTLRTALFGKEVSDFKEGEDDYPIRIRLKPEYRSDLASLMNLKITFRDQASGKIAQVPISSVADFQYGTTYNSVNRKDMDRVITVWSNVIEGFNASEVNTRLKALMADFKMPPGYSWKFTGEQEEQEETSKFLVGALLIALALIMLILVSQFNSFAKPLIIMASVIFSTIGVFLGLAAFKMDFVIIMTGIGIISLAGVVVNNAIVLIDYTDFLKLRAKKRLGMDEDDHLPINDAMECVIQAGCTRLRPVLLTAITTVLGLVPMAIGLNFDFITFFSRFDPQIYIGGDNAIFWGPMSWTVIFGLTFATLLTLVVVPAMYIIGSRIKLYFLRRFNKLSVASLTDKG